MVVVASLLILPVLDQEQTSVSAVALVWMVAGVANFLTVHWSIVIAVLDLVAH